MPLLLESILHDWTMPQKILEKWWDKWDKQTVSRWRRGCQSRCSGLKSGTSLWNELRLGTQKCHFEVIMEVLSNCWWTSHLAVTNELGVATKLVNMTSLLLHKCIMWQCDVSCRHAILVMWMLARFYQASNDTMTFSHLSGQPKETGNEPELSQRDSSKTMDLKHWGMEGLSLPWPKIHGELVIFPFDC